MAVFHQKLLSSKEIVFFLSINYKVLKQHLFLYMFLHKKSYFDFIVKFK